MTSLATPKPLSSSALTLRCHGNVVGGTNTSGWSGRRFTSTNQNAWDPWPSGTHLFLLKYPPYSCQQPAFPTFVACSEGCAGCIARLEFSGFPLRDHAVPTAMWPLKQDCSRLIDNRGVIQVLSMVCCVQFHKGFVCEHRMGAWSNSSRYL
jgi:hypothetical protein